MEQDYLHKVLDGYKASITALIYAEWKGAKRNGTLHCPMCKRSKDKGHKDDCLIKIALDAFKNIKA